jgi:hypothetical protein
MKRAWKVILILTLTALALGVLCFSLSLVLGSDLTRIADAVFTRYDLTQTLMNFQALMLRIKSIF